mmetsp:Transcript_8821/g.26432  ORF Transcript_8821/g.26432 Transcript_8821/m.26432 type:complete len:235 (-) Transcript_8821:140-844(-)
MPLRIRPPRPPIPPKPASRRPPSAISPPAPCGEGRGRCSAPRTRGEVPGETRGAPPPLSSPWPAHASSDGQGTAGAGNRRICPGVLPEWRRAGRRGGERRVGGRGRGGSGKKERRGKVGRPLTLGGGRGRDCEVARPTPTRAGGDIREAGRARLKLKESFSLRSGTRIPEGDVACPSSRLRLSSRRLRSPPLLRHRPSLRKTRHPRPICRRSCLRVSGLSCPLPRFGATSCALW